MRKIKRRAACARRNPCRPAGFSPAKTNERSTGASSHGKEYAITRRVAVCMLLFLSLRVIDENFTGRMGDQVRIAVVSGQCQIGR